MTDIPEDRAVLFVDYENARQWASRLYLDGSRGAGHFSPRELGRTVCHRYNEYKREADTHKLKLLEVRVYRGVPDRNRENPKYVDQVERERVWIDPPELDRLEGRDVKVTVVGAPLQYPSEWMKSERERSAPVEKEVDTAIAADMVAMAQDALFDVAILFSGDGDLRPPVLAVLDRNTIGRAIPVHRVGWAYKGEKSILWIEPNRLPDGSDSPAYPLWKGHYTDCADETNYLAQYLRRYSTGDVVNAEVVDANKGGLVVAVDQDLLGFVPWHQLLGMNEYPTFEHLQGYVGRLLALQTTSITDDLFCLGHGQTPVILSERGPAVQEWRAEQKDRLLDELHEGEIRAGRITSIRPFGVFVDLGGADGLAHLSELSWERDIDPEQMFTIGQQVNVYITKIDKESKKIGLSIRRASPEQWDEVVAKLEVGQIVPSVVTKLVTFGAFARLEGPVEGLVHVSELADRRINHPREIVLENDVIPVKIVRIERDRHRLGLSLRQARSDAERAGWRFDSEGRIARLPDAVAEQFGVEPDQPWLRSG